MDAPIKGSTVVLIFDHGMVATGRIIQMKTESEEVDVTIDYENAIELGVEPDYFRRIVPGKVRTVLTVELEP